MWTLLNGEFSQFYLITYFLCSSHYARPNVYEYYFESSCWLRTTFRFCCQPCTWMLFTTELSLFEDIPHFVSHRCQKAEKTIHKFLVESFGSFIRKRVGWCVSTNTKQPTLLLKKWDGRSLFILSTLFWVWVNQAHLFQFDWILPNRVTTCNRQIRTEASCIPTTWCWQPRRHRRCENRRMNLENPLQYIRKHKTIDMWC